MALSRTCISFFGLVSLAAHSAPAFAGDSDAQYEICSRMFDIARIRQIEKIQETAGRMRHPVRLLVQSLEDFHASLTPEQHEAIQTYIRDDKRLRREQSKRQTSLFTLRQTLAQQLGSTLRPGLDRNRRLFTRVTCPAGTRKVHTDETYMNRSTSDVGHQIETTLNHEYTICDTANGKQVQPRWMQDLDVVVGEGVAFATACTALEGTLACLNLNLADGTLSNSITAGAGGFDRPITEASATTSETLAAAAVLHPRAVRPGFFVANRARGLYLSHYKNRFPGCEGVLDLYESRKPIDLQAIAGADGAEKQDPATSTSVAGLETDSDARRAE